MVAQYTLSDLPEGPDAAWIAGGQREYVRRVQVVVTDDGVDPVIVPKSIGPHELLTQIKNVDPTLDVGIGYKVTIDGKDDENEYATCRSLVPQRDPSARNRWVVTATYNTLAETNNSFKDAGDVDIGRWDTERPLVRFQQIFFTEHAKRAILFSKGAIANGKEKCPPDFDYANVSNWTELEQGAITNSAGGWIGDPPPERDMERQGLVVERNLNKIDLAQIALLTNSVNTEADFSFTWNGTLINIPRYQGKIKSIVPREHYRGGTWVWRVRYEFDIWDRTWIEDFMNTGYEAVELANLQAAAFDAKQGSTIKDAASLISPSPTFLGPDGEAKDIVTVGAGGNARVDVSQICYRSYLLYDKADWNTPMLENFPNNHTIP